MYPEALINKLPDERLRRIVRGRVAGKILSTLAWEEDISDERVRQLYNKAKQQLEILKRTPDPLTPSTRVADILVSARLRRVFAQLEITTLKELATKQVRDLLMQKGCGTNTTMEAVRLLKRVGLAFQSDADSEHWISKIEEKLVAECEIGED